MDEAKERKFRETAMSKFGFKKGAISKALEEAIDLWIEQESGSLEPHSDPTQSLVGLLEGLSETSVELQHLGSKLFIKR